MAGYAEAGAELPSPWNIPFRIWLKLPDLARKALVLLVFYPIIAFLSVVTIFQILPYFINIEPVQRYALRGLGIDKQNLIETSGVIDTVSLVNFKTDVTKTFDPVYIKRGQTVGFVAQIISDGEPREQLPVCVQPLPARAAEGVEIGRIVVSIPRYNFESSKPYRFSREMQSSVLISDKDWQSEQLEGAGVSDDLRVNIRYEPGPLYAVIPPGAAVVSDIPANVAASYNLALACEEYEVQANIRIAKPALLLSR